MPARKSGLSDDFFLFFKKLCSSKAHKLLWEKISVDSNSEAACDLKASLEAQQDGGVSESLHVKY